MSGDGVGRAVSIELAYSRSQQDGQGQRAPTARAVYDSRPGKVHSAVAQVPAVPDLREPAATPQPVTVDGIKNGPHEEFREYEGLEVDTLRDGANNDVAGGLHEDHFEEEE